MGYFSLPCFFITTIKKKTDNVYEYENESVMNGGILNNKGLIAHDTYEDQYGKITNKNDF